MNILKEHIICKKLILSLLLLFIYACNDGNNSTAENTANNKATTALPGGLQKLTLGADGALNAYITIDNDTINKKVMLINTAGAGSASLSLPGLSRAPHTITITYEYTLDGSIYVLATANKRIDLSSGSARLSFSARDYEIDIHDDDSDGSNNAAELRSGTDPRDETDIPSLAFSSGFFKNVRENTTSTGYQAVASEKDDAPLSFSITGGLDQNRFNINSTSGILTFKQIMDFEAPSDSDQNNIYEVLIEVSDGSNQLTRNVSITLTDVVIEPGFVLRNNSGGEAYTDSLGQLWRMDEGFNTGNLTTIVDGVTVAGTDDPGLYLSGRFDAGSAPELRYRFNVPNGAYIVVLHFADTFNDTQGEGLRIFDVLMEDNLVLEDLDIFAEVGGNRALMKTLAVTVTDGVLDIDFLHQTQDPEIRAIEIIENTRFVLRINAGAGDYTDSLGQLWQADKGFNTGRLSESGGPDTQISGTDDDVLYQSGRFDVDESVDGGPELRYSFKVPDGMYSVGLHFAETFNAIQDVGLRVFDVTLEDRLALEGLDIFAEAGGVAH